MISDGNNQKNGDIVLFGIFDGVHIGHRALIRSARELADRIGVGCVAWSFDGIPGIKGSEALMPTDLRTLFLREYGADRVIYEDFEAVMNLSPEEFFEKTVVDKLGASGCVCGFNFRFGIGGSGDTETLAELCEKHGIVCLTVDEVTVPFGGKNLTVSSTAIRELAEKGDVEGAEVLLGHPFVTSGKVMHGRTFGRTVGFPTANQEMRQGLIYPPAGVYATFCRIDGRYYPAVTNIGSCPTVTDGKKVTVETHIIGYSGDLYGKDLPVFYMKRLRGEKKFPSVELLLSEIDGNVRTAKEMFEEKSKKPGELPGILR